MGITMITPEDIQDQYPNAPVWRLSHPDGSPYLDRHVLWGDDCLDTHTGAKSHCFLHRLYTADGDRHRHSHPWKKSISLILSGGYVEARNVGLKQPIDERYIPTQAYTVGDLNVLPHETYHSIKSVEPDTWTLFLAGPEVSGWGFWVDGEHIDHKKYYELEGVQKMKTERLR